MLTAAATESLVSRLAQTLIWCQERLLAEFAFIADDGNDVALAQRQGERWTYDIFAENMHQCGELMHEMGIEASATVVAKYDAEAAVEEPELHAVEMAAVAAPAAVPPKAAHARGAHRAARHELLATRVERHLGLRLHRGSWRAR